MRLEWPHEHQGARRMDDIQSFEDEAQAYLDTAVSEMLDDESLENAQLANSLKDAGEASFRITSELEDKLTDQISESVDEQMEEAVSEAVEEAVEEAIDSWIQELIDYYNINPEAILEIGDDYIIVDCNKTEC